MPTPIDREEVQRLVRREQAQLVEVLPSDELGRTPPKRNQLPVEDARRRVDPRAHSRAAGDRLLLRLPMRHESTSRVAAREHRLHARLRLRRR